jgi:hypothetical protein
MGPIADLRTREAFVEALRCAVSMGNPKVIEPEKTKRTPMEEWVGAKSWRDFENKTYPSEPRRG